MGESIKDKLIEKALDEVFDVIIGKSKEEIIQIVFKDSLKDTLFRVMKEFSNTDYFRYAFQEFVFLSNQSFMERFDEKSLNISLSFDELEVNIGKVVKEYFNSDEISKINKLIKIITEKYIAKALLKVNLADLLVKQENLYKNTMKQLDKQYEILKEIRDQKESDEEYKRNLMHGELNLLLLHELNDIANRYGYFVLKRPISLKGDMDLYTKLKEIINDIDNNIKEDFMKKPIRIIDASQPQVLQRVLTGQNVEREISYREFVYSYFKLPIIKKIDKINGEYSNQLTKSFLKNLIKLKDKMKSGFLIVGLEYGINIPLENVNFNVNELRNFIKEVGLIIIDLYEEINK